MNLDNLSPEFIDDLLDKFFKNQYVRIEFTVKPDIAKEVISFVEKLIQEDRNRHK